MLERPKPKCTLSHLSYGGNTGTHSLRDCFFSWEETSLSSCDMFDTKEKLNRSPLTCSVEWE